MQPVVNLFEYERLAKARMTLMAFDYYASGAMDEITVKANHRAYDEIFLRYRVLAGVGTRDTSTSVLGHKMTMPVLVAPMAFHGLAHPLGELATAQGAAAAGIIFVMSTLSNTRMEDVAKASNGPRWFQLYVYKDRGVTRSLVQRAETAGFTALELTVDAPVVGQREADVRNHFHLPDGLTAANLIAPEFGQVPEGAGQSGMAAYFTRLNDENLTWRDVEWLRSITKLPVLVKGVARGDDAKLAVESGAAGIVVSNHGDRQLDTARPTIHVLPEVVEAVAGRVWTLKYAPFALIAAIIICSLGLADTPNYDHVRPVILAHDWLNKKLALNNRGTMLISGGSPSSLPDGLVLITPGHLEKFAAVGDNVPGSVDWHFAGFEESALNERDEVVFSATLAPCDVSDPSCGSLLPRGNGVFLYSRGEIRTIAISVDGAPGTSGEEFDSAPAVQINNDGNLAFAANSSRPGHISVFGGTTITGFIEAISTYPDITLTCHPCSWHRDQAYQQLNSIFAEFDVLPNAIFGQSDPIALAAVMWLQKCTYQTIPRLLLERMAIHKHWQQF